MIDKINVFDKNLYISSLVRKLENALQRMPILPEDVVIMGDDVHVSVEGQEHVLSLDFSISVEENIYNIRKYLYNNVFPRVIFSNGREESLSTVEIKKLLNEGVSLEEALSRKRLITEEEKFIINRVIVKRDEVFLKNQEDDEDERLYKMQMPVTVFLKRLRTGKINEREAGELLKEKSIFIKKIYPEKEWNKIVNLNKEKK